MKLLNSNQRNCKISNGVRQECEDKDEECIETDNPETVKSLKLITDDFPKAFWYSHML